MTNPNIFGQPVVFNESTTFNRDITINGSVTGNLTGNIVGNVSGNVTGNLNGNVNGNITGNINGNAYSTGISTFSNLKISGPLYDSSSSLGASGQILSSNGSATLWINASSASVGSATSVGTNLDSTNVSRYLTFVENTSGNNIIRVDSDLTYNPNTNTFGNIQTGILTASSLKITNGLYDGSNSLGSSGQILSSNGSSTLWINSSSANVGSATSIGINLDSTNASRYVTFVESTSGNNLVKVYSDLTYNPSTNTLTATNITATLTGTASALVTGSNYQVSSFGVGTAPSGTAGEIRATNNITAYYSDRRLKENIKVISSALSKILKLNGVTFNSNKLAEGYGYYDKKEQVGVIAQEVEAVLPQIVVPAPFDIGQDENGSEYSISGENYKTVQYEKLIPLLIEGIKEQQKTIEKLEKRIGYLESK